jgi:hypothetical protein
MICTKHLAMLMAAVTISFSQGAQAQAAPSGIDTAAFGLGATLRIDFSAPAVGFFNQAGWRFQGLGGVSVQSTDVSSGRYNTLSLLSGMPLSGGFEFNAFSEDSNWSWLKAENLAFDATGQYLRADVSVNNDSSANKTLNFFALRDVTQATGDAAVASATLQFTREARDYFSLHVFPNGGGADILLDSVTDKLGTLTLSSPVPEPLSAWLMLLGGLAVGAVRRGQARRKGSD